MEEGREEGREEKREGGKERGRRERNKEGVWEAVATVARQSPWSCAHREGREKELTKHKLNTLKKPLDLSKICVSIQVEGNKHFHLHNPLVVVPEP